ncbi:SNF2-related protein [Caballeronia arationis]|jgi:SNF2 family DNA or RNA helicase|uniref:DEAD/DEAH box helicase n=1 Tax=Caballeronia arationis TaxID=1777142 RepID=UPI00074C3FEE|nr:DEAD/DEAH box helicase [Caballeronia arationis]SAK48913.1 SNF2-related protein [Caballeronia arationis]
MNDTTTPISYDRSQITHWLDARTVAKAVGYVGAVSGMRWQGGGCLTARVQGTQRAPYAVNLVFIRSRSGIELHDACTCPVGYRCKHVGAVLLANLQSTSDVQPDPAQPGGMRPELAEWLKLFRAHIGSTRRTTAASSESKSQAAYALVYLLAAADDASHPDLKIFKVRLAVDGSIRDVERWNATQAALANPAKFVTDDDLTILRALAPSRLANDVMGRFYLSGPDGAAIVSKLLATGRLLTRLEKSAAGQVEAGAAMREGAPRPGRIDWMPETSNRLRPVLRAEPDAAAILPTDPPWYLDAQTGEAGVIEAPMPARQLADYLRMPPISLAEAPLVAEALRECASALPQPLPLPPLRDSGEIRVIDTAPEPVLTLDTLPVHVARFGKYDHRATSLDFAMVGFDYDGLTVDAESATTQLQRRGDELVEVRRRADAENERLQQLADAGLQKLSLQNVYGPKPFPVGLRVLNDPKAWERFVADVLPVLRRDGWRVKMTRDFTFNVIEIDDIDGSAHSSGDGWFDVEMGITAGERKLRLEPLLADLFRRDRRWLTGMLDSIADDEGVELRTDSGERLRLLASRLKPVVRVLIDLFSGMREGETLRIPALDAGRLAALDDTHRWQFRGDTAVIELARRLQGANGPRETAPPAGLNAELRAYQREGLAWMQFLREHGLSGVLADDMGLGKTVQTLAHILAEKEAGRLDRPALIVLPTTLVHNWCEEARRFAPGLRVLNLHGPERHDRFAQIGEHDLILTTYALLWRDHEALVQHDYHLLILDEAQYVKNATTKSAASIRSLRARHRLCLTGTPLENHLGELWAQFDFLLPGFLGSQRDFAKRWRTPIEKDGDSVRRQLLARRIRPFMLRRRKDEVAKELPPKTTIVRTVDLEGAQRDLYETVRSAMQEKVRAAISEHGFARSHIVVLDALLKLRQVCCDPSLVKLKQAKRVEESAKLDLLLAMLPELIEEGRRVLVFSQFTGMLAIIAAALDKAGIAYAMLTGETTDRRAAVRRFQEGVVPLFLISLKAGGVGLNLTAADTVIHYDPWWNPAAENQATDRAHRLGQDKPVFVYKLIAAGSIEEKIVAMQEKKAALAASILSDDAAGAVKFSAEDLDALFAPIPSV